jgi:ubiquitin C-terminal hydrolase
MLHLGKHMNEGHYICIVKRNKKWYLCDDEDVKEIPEKKILDGNAYLLFYRQEYI